MSGEVPLGVHLELERGWAAHLPHMRFSAAHALFPLAAVMTSPLSAVLRAVSPPEADENGDVNVRSILVCMDDMCLEAGAATVLTTLEEQVTL